MCHYDAQRLTSEQVRRLAWTHPELASGGNAPVPSSDYRDLVALMAELHRDPLPEPDAVLAERPVAPEQLAAIRSLVRQHAAPLALTDDVTEDGVLAITEAATNAIEHGGGGGRLRVWVDTGALVCEVSNRSGIIDPATGAGWLFPDPGARRGRGLRVIGQLCDHVDIHHGTVRLHLESAESDGERH